MVDLSRRGFLLGLRTLGRPETVREATTALRAQLQPPRPFLRPPGAGSEARFTRLCDGCGECVTACPHHAILVLDERWGPAENTAGVLPGTNPCRWCDGRPCISACPTGALATSPRPAMGLAIIDEDRCLGRAGTGCQACYDTCPLKGLALYHDGFAPAVDRHDCVGCGACLPPCPAAALTVRPSDPALTALHVQLGLHAP